jgi:uncharacterized protein (DUF342 family)
VRAKYFTANSEQAAEEMALDYFRCTRQELKIDVIVTGSGPRIDEPVVRENAEAPVETAPQEQKSWEILAIMGNPMAVNRMNAFSGLYYEPDGVYLEIYAERGNGEKLETQNMLHHLSRKNIINLSLPAVQELVKRGSGRAKIALEQKEHFYGEDLSILITGDELQASVRLIEPEMGGAALSFEDAKRKVAEAGVEHGLDEEALKTVIDNKDYGEPYVIANATPPTDGVDGKLVFHFSTDERTGAPREIDHGRVDYRSLDLYVPVEEGQLLVTREYATDGVPGVSVKGNPIRQKPGKDVQMPRGKNINVNEERTTMHATCPGMVEYVSNAINVSNVYTVKGDCDISVGNIDFEGSVHISGSVRTGNTVKATNGITVGGSVEAATLIAGGNVEVKGGMQGSGKGTIESNGSVKVLFIERGTIIADGPITVDVSIHSILETGSTIHALGKRGAIIGGQASAAGDIVANYVGALSNTKTSIEVGFLPRKRARLAKLEKEMEILTMNQTKLAQLDAYLAKSKATMDPATYEKLYISGVENKKNNELEAQAITEEMQTLRYEMDHATDSKVHVFETTFSGSRIVIGSSTYKVNDEVSFATFKYSDGEVVYMPCEVNKADFKAK